jgi:hypothetical protein
VSDVTINNELKLGICLKKAAQQYSFQSWLDHLYRCPKIGVGTNNLLPYRGCLNVHEKNTEKTFQTKKINYCYYYY